MKNVLLTLIVLTLTACSTLYVKPGASKTDFLHDRNDCIVKAGQAGYYGGNLGDNIRRNGFIGECLEGQGWNKQ